MVERGKQTLAGPPVKSQLSARARAGLDVARAAAAVYVVSYHVIASLHVPGIVRVIFSFGQEAVLVFFLLSGFVIFANESTRTTHPRGYYLRRLRRIYPPIILAIAVSALMSISGFIHVKLTWPSLVATLLSVQDIGVLKPGVIASPYADNAPLWSLSYEVFFYAIFPLVMIAWRRSERLTRHAVGVVAVLSYVIYLAFPNHFSLLLAYFLVWWIGAMAARYYLVGELHFSSISLEFGYLFALVLAASSGTIFFRVDGVGTFPVLMVRHFVVALALMLILVTPARSWLGRASARGAVAGSAGASISYGLYVLHYPLLVQSQAFRSISFAAFLPALFALAWVSDKGLPKILPRAPRD